MSLGGIATTANVPKSNIILFDINRLLTCLPSLFVQKILTIVGYICTSMRLIINKSLYYSTPGIFAAINVTKYHTALL